MSGFIKPPTIAQAADAEQLMPATAIEDLDDPNQLPQLVGCKMVQVHASLCYPSIETGDVLDVDFDVRTFRGDHLYLVTMHDNGPSQPPTWFGARYFMRGLRGPMVRDETRNGAQWIDAPPEMMARFRFYGVVRDVWKKVQYGQ